MSVAGNGTLSKYLTRAAPSFLDHNWSMAIWLCPSGGAPSQGDGYQTPWSIEAPGWTLSSFYFNQSPNNRDLYYYSSNLDTLILANVSATVPTFFAVTHDGDATNSTIVYYGIPGSALVKNSLGADSFIAGVGTIWLYTQSANNEPFNGEIIAQAYYASVLTDAQVNAVYRQMAPKVAQGGGMFYPLLNVATGRYDASGNELNYTATGTLVDSRRMPPVPWIGGGAGIR